jgi:DNA-binding Xre family transcriptional regulator
MTAKLDYTWKLREVMATRGLFQTTHLRPKLAERGIHLSDSQVYRLVTDKPERLNLKILMALLDILGCQMDDLIQPAALPAARAKSKTAGQNCQAAEPGIGAFRPKRARIVPGPAHPRRSIPESTLRQRLKFGLAGRDVLSAVACSAASRSSGGQPLSRNWRAPAARARARRPPWKLIAIAGIRRSPAIARSRPRPSGAVGRRTSTSATSGACSRARSSAVRAVPASPVTWKPGEAARKLRSAARTLASSSAIRTRTGPGRSSPVIKGPSFCCLLRLCL